MYNHMNNSKYSGNPHCFALIQRFLGTTRKANQAFCPKIQFLKQTFQLHYLVFQDQYKFTKSLAFKWQIFSIYESRIIGSITVAQRLEAVFHFALLFPTLEVHKILIEF